MFWKFERTGTPSILLKITEFQGVFKRSEKRVIEEGWVHVIRLRSHLTERRLVSFFPGN
jgi:hypothetical protein